MANSKDGFVLKKPQNSTQTQGVERQPSTVLAEIDTGEQETVPPGTGALQKPLHQSLDEVDYTRTQPAQEVGRTNNPTQAPTLPESNSQTGNAQGNPTGNHVCSSSQSVINPITTAMTQESQQHLLPLQVQLCQTDCQCRTSQTVYFQRHPGSQCQLNPHCNYITLPPGCGCVHNSPNQTCGPCHANRHNVLNRGSVMNCSNNQNAPVNHDSVREPCASGGDTPAQQGHQTELLQSNVNLQAAQNTDAEDNPNERLLSRSNQENNATAALGIDMRNPDEQGNLLDEEGAVSIKGAEHPMRKKVLKKCAVILGVIFAVVVLSVVTTVIYNKFSPQHTDSTPSTATVMDTITTTVTPHTTLPHHSPTTMQPTVSPKLSSQKPMTQPITTTLGSVSPASSQTPLTCNMPIQVYCKSRDEPTVKELHKCTVEVCHRASGDKCAKRTDCDTALTQGEPFKCRPDKRHLSFGEDRSREMTFC